MGDSFVRLTDEVRSEYAKTMAHIWTRVEELRAKKARDSKKTQDDIDEELERIGEIARIVNADGQPQDQMALKFGEDGRVPDDQAKQALAAIVARQPDCTVIDARECGIHGRCTCEPALRICQSCDYAMQEVSGAAAYLCPNCPDTTLLQVLPEGPAPAVKSPSCVLHGVNAPHATEPPAQAEPELTEPQIVEAMAKEAVEEWARSGITPESRVDMNSRVKEAIAASSIPTRRRKPFREAVARLLSDVPSLPAGAGASDAPVDEVDGNVAEAEEAQPA